MTMEHIKRILRKLWPGKAKEALPEEQVEGEWEHLPKDESYLKSLPEEERESLRAEMYRNIWQEIRERQPDDLPVEEEEETVIPLYADKKWYWTAAASVVILLAGGWLTLSLLVQPAPFTQLAAGFGERREVVLPDGSLVILNGNSAIRFAPDWQEGQAREVWLEGEAYFSVRHTSDHQRFVVNTLGELHVEVLGTKFNVQDRRGTTKVVLQEGKVKVSAAEEAYVMAPGQKVTYSADQPQLLPESVNPHLLVAWKDNVLVYQDEPLGEIAQQLADSHGLRIRFRDEALRQEVFNGSFPADEPAVFFEKLEKLFPVKVRRQDNSYMIE